MRHTLTSSRPAHLAAVLAALGLALAACQPAAPVAPTSPPAPKPTEAPKPVAPAATSAPAPAPAATAAAPTAAPKPTTAAKPAAPKSSKDTLTMVGRFNQGTLDPHFAATSQDTLFTRNVYSALIRYKANGIELEPDLATSWEVAPDGLTYTFKLRQGVEWHKGYGPFSAADVKASFERLLDPATKSPFAGSLGMLHEVQVVDDATVKLVLKEPYAGFLHLLTPYRTGPIINVRAAKEKGENFPWDPIGTGPYIFESRIPNREGVLLANERYFGGPPPLKKVIFQTIPDQNAQVLGLESGQYDLVYTLIEDRAVANRLKGRGFKENLLSRGLPEQVMMNVTVKPFDDVRVRQAIAHAVDRAQYAELARGGLGEPWYSPLPKGYFAATEDVPRYERDVAKAKQLLAEAGYPDGLEVTMTNYDDHKLPGDVVVEQLKQAGIRARLEILDQPTWIGRLFQGQVHFTVHCCVRQPDPDIWLTDAFTPRGGALGVSKYNLEADLIPARRELDAKKREQMYHEIQRKIMRDVPMVPLIMRLEPQMHNAKLQGLPTTEAIWGLDFTRLSFE